MKSSLELRERATEVLDVSKKQRFCLSLQKLSMNPCLMTFLMLIELDLAIIYHRPNFAWEVASFKYKVSVIWPPSLNELFTQKWKLTHSETQKKIFWGTKQLLVPIDFHSRERNTIEINGGPSTVWLIFFKISSFMFNIRKKLKQVWNDMRVTKWWQTFTFWVNYSFNMVNLTCFTFGFDRLDCIE